MGVRRDGKWEGMGVGRDRVGRDEGWEGMRGRFICPFTPKTNQAIDNWRRESSES